MAVHLAKGARDFLPDQMRNRLAVMAILRDVFERFGFEPLDTPAFERIETLTGKYGDEGEKLMFRILKRGEGGKKGEVDMALRYDLTVPLARVVAMNPSLRMPFKRYQMAPVWRADRPSVADFESSTSVMSTLLERPRPSRMRSASPWWQRVLMRSASTTTWSGLTTGGSCARWRALSGPLTKRRRCSWPWISSTRWGVTV